VVVEGYLDVLALAQFDATHVVATLGTALTVDHLRLLGRYTRNVTALFDGDAAGRNAAARSFEVFQQAGLWGHAAFLPEGSDPDTFVRTQGKAALDRVLESAVPIVDFYLSSLRARHGTDLGGKSRLANEVSRMLAKVTNPLDRELLARRSSDLLGIREESLRRHAATAGAGTSGSTDAARRREQGAVNRWSLGEDRAESALVALMLRFPSVVRTLRKEPMDKLVTEKWREVIRRILAGPEPGGEVALGVVTEELPAELASEISELVLRGQEIAEEERDRMTADCLFFLQRRYLRRLDQELCTAIRVAEETRDDEVKKERMRQWQEVMQRKLRLERERPSL
jgi:DNA primase